MNRQSQRHRFGFTLIELVIVVAIIGLLLSLTASGVQKAREASNRVSCENRIRQLALGVQMFHDTSGIIPPNGGQAPNNLLSLVGGSAVTAQTLDLHTGLLYKWGVGDAKRPARDQTGSWAFSILPFVELQNEYDTKAVNGSYALFRCPSRPRGDALVPVNDLNGEYESGGLAMAKTDYCGNGRLMPNRPEFVSFRDLLDGHSQTIMLGEKAFDPVVQTDTSWFWDEPIWIGGSAGTTRNGFLVFRDGVGIPFEQNWGSPHDGGAFFAFADGHVQFVTVSADWRLFAATLSPRGHEPATITE